MRIFNSLNDRAGDNCDNGSQRVLQHGLLRVLPLCQELLPCCWQSDIRWALVTFSKFYFICRACLKSILCPPYVTPHSFFRSNKIPAEHGSNPQIFLTLFMTFFTWYKRIASIKFFSVLPTRGWERRFFV